MTPPLLTPDILKCRCVVWQVLLALQDWTIHAQLVRQSALGDGVHGNCQPHHCKRQAVISLLDPRDVDGQGFVEPDWDWELTLVHELLHLHIHDLFPQGWPGDRSEAGKAAERAIDHLAHALIMLSRAGTAAVRTRVSPRHVVTRAKTPRRTRLDSDKSAR